MPLTLTTERTDTDERLGGSLGDLSQVVIFNDNHNNAEYVVDCLIRVFRHSAALAVKIMYEAHTRGRAIAEVEATEAATAHCAELQQAGLGAEVESV